MNIVCVICRELLVPSDDIFHTPCGHIFHYACLCQWLERSKTCPQCREKTTVHKIHRLYLNFSSNDSITEDRCSLQEKVDKLSFDLKLKEKDIKHYVEKSQKFEKQAVELKKEVIKVEREVKAREVALYAYKDQIEYFKLQIDQVAEKDKELANVKNELQNYKNIQQLLQGSEEEVKEILLRSTDRSSLATYVTALKRELLITMGKRREWRDKLKNMQQELSRVTVERNTLSDERVKRKKLEEEVLAYETKIMRLENKIRDLEQRGPSEKAPNSVNSIPAAASSNKPCAKCNKYARIRNLLDEETRKDGGVTEVSCDNNKNSPYLPVRSTGVCNLDKRLLKRDTVKSSILTKKPRLERPGNVQTHATEVNIITYNGLGGHSKVEHFPSSSGMGTKKT